MTQNRSSIITGILLVSGTSIGGGMLALPVLTAYAGFVPSLVAYFFCWLFMMSTGLLFLEVALSMPAGANIISMSERTLGLFGKAYSWMLYLFQFYCLMVAYTVGCGDFLLEFAAGNIPAGFGPLLVVCLFGPLLYLGTRTVSKINNMLMFVLCLSFAAFIIFGLPLVNLDLLQKHNWNYTYMALPIAFTSFAYQGIIPTLVTYLDRDVSKIKKSIVYGNLLTFAIYLVWQAIIQGVVPLHGSHGLAEALANGDNAITPFQHFTSMPLVSLLGIIFAFAALITSFFGVSLGLMDFFADGLNIKKDAGGTLMLCAMVFIPPTIIAYSHPHLFLKALEYAGGYGCALLLGLLPIAMVWSKRYYLQQPSTYKFPGGKLALLILVLIVVVELLAQMKVSLDHL